MADAVLKRTTMKRSPKRKNIPQELIYEMVDGKPIYYQNYKQVLIKKKSAEEIMGSSFLQGQLVALIVTFLMSKLDLGQICCCHK